MIADAPPNFLSHGAIAELFVMQTLSEPMQILVDFSKLKLALPIFALESGLGDGTTLTPHLAAFAALIAERCALIADASEGADCESAAAAIRAAAGIAEPGASANDSRHGDADQHSAGVAA